MDAWASLQNRTEKAGEHLDNVATRLRGLARAIERDGFERAAETVDDATGAVDEASLKLARLAQQNRDAWA